MCNAGDEFRSKPTAEERKAAVEEKRLAFDQTWPRRLLPAFATIAVAILAVAGGITQNKMITAATDRATNEAASRRETEWGFRVVELYLTKHEFFDMSSNPEQAQRNLKALAAVAPDEVQGVINAELSLIPPPSGVNGEYSRLASLAAIAAVQDAIAVPGRGQLVSPSLKPSAFTIYLQYPDGKRAAAETAQAFLSALGYRVPGIEQVRDAPSLLEVRYYRADQRGAAEELAMTVAEMVAQPAGQATAKMLSSSRRLPAGIMEVWLPK